MPSVVWVALARPKRLLNIPIAIVRSTGISSGSEPRARWHCRQALSRSRSYSTCRNRTHPTLLTRCRPSSAGWNVRVSGCSSSIMPIRLSCSKHLTRVHPGVTSCSPREHSSSTRWALPGRLLSRRCSQRKRWAFSPNAQTVLRVTRQRGTLPDTWPLNWATCPWRWNKRLRTS